MAVRKINTVEKLIGFACTGAIDLFCLFISWIPGVDLIGWPLKVAGLISMLFYFAITGAMSQKYFGEVLATFLIGGGVTIIPGIDDFIPSLTGMLWNLYRILEKARKEESEEAARKAEDSARHPRLSRAA